MNLAKLSANGQITVPVEIRRMLRLDPGDKVLFTQNSSGEVVMAKVTRSGLTVAQQQPQSSGTDPDLEKDPIELLIEELRSGPAS